MAMAPPGIGGATLKQRDRRNGLIPSAIGATALILAIAATKPLVNRPVSGLFYAYVML